MKNNMKELNMIELETVSGGGNLNYPYQPNNPCPPNYPYKPNYPYQPNYPYKSNDPNYPYVR